MLHLSTSLEMLISAHKNKNKIFFFEISLENRFIREVFLFDSPSFLVHGRNNFFMACITDGREIPRHEDSFSRNSLLSEVFTGS